MGVSKWIMAYINQSVFDRGFLSFLFMLRVVVMPSMQLYYFRQVDVLISKQRYHEDMKSTLERVKLTFNSLFMIHEC